MIKNIWNKLKDMFHNHFNTPKGMEFYDLFGEYESEMEDLEEKYDELLIELDLIKKKIKKPKKILLLIIDDKDIV